MQFFIAHEDKTFPAFPRSINCENFFLRSYEKIELEGGGAFSADYILRLCFNCRCEVGMNRWLSQRLCIQLRFCAD